MSRFPLAAALIIAALPATLTAQEPRPTVVIANSTPKAIGEAMRDALADQKFKLSSARKGRIVLSQARGNIAQATGEIMRVRLEVGFAVEEVPGGHRVTVVDETLIAEHGIGTEQRRAQDLERNRQAYQNLLNQVRAAIESPAAADTAPPADAGGRP